MMFHWEKWTRRLIQPGEVVNCNELKEGGVDEEHADKIPPGRDFVIANLKPIKLNLDLKGN